MSDFVEERNVFVGQDLGSREDVLRFISGKAVELGYGASVADVLKAFEVREKEGPTGMMDGIAVPHAKSNAIGRVGIIVVRTTKALTWPSFDEAPIDVSIALMVPEDKASTTHLKLLSKLAVLVMDEDFRSNLRQMQEPGDIARCINAGLPE
ncbi:MAG: fructose PTS transporter subunit IIA [Atopobiaceae bacterium]|nr:fructose PTS transporter subunit IIA [Atopobiaceae bacterium]MCH4181343.1 fructose PTS transporter subunit IIA [Atopobiaceae bacterium]MCH4213502.1 fructose PTS transporter subunit IIA [Atopobiaceae bacterium]MCH4229724.1 fructose PTS transporter subunit IIA [Atopobiaceae bacterium]MCH4276149.1 fructose PTS transporter subunit IIA [Atopobiaceae bacterium]